MRYKKNISTLPELYYFGVVTPNQNQGISGNSNTERSGHYDLVVTPKNLRRTLSGFVGNTDVGTLVIPHIIDLANYSFYGLKCTNLIILSDNVPTYDNSTWQTYGFSVTNYYVPDAMVNAYRGVPYANMPTPKPLSTFINSGNKYSQMVKTLYERSILVRDWLYGE